MCNNNITYNRLTCHTYQFYYITFNTVPDGNSSRLPIMSSKKQLTIERPLEQSIIFLYCFGR